MDAKPIWIGIAVVAVLAAVFLAIRTGEELAPEPVTAWVAVLPEGESEAIVGPVSRPAGTRFELVAVLEAKTLRGERIYYAEAEELRFPDGPIAADRIRRWQRTRGLKILWFTVESSPPFVDAASETAAPKFFEVLQADWARAWRVPGSVAPSLENFLPNEERVARNERFGLQRFQVRFEFFKPGNDLIPELRLTSWGADRLPAEAEDFPSMTLTLAEPLALPSSVFGQTQVESEPASQAGEASGGEPVPGATFARIQLLAAWLERHGLTWEGMRWTGVELDATQAGAAPGDLLRVGDRVVWYWLDEGEPGLDYEDLCLDFERGARVLRLRDVFAGDGLVEWAPLEGRGA